MTERERVLEGILGIAHATSTSGGLSLEQALERASYQAHRSAVSAFALLEILRLKPELAEQWLRYSEDKRTTGGWYVKHDGEVGRVLMPESRVAFDTTPEAVAEYVLRELDYWAASLGLGKGHQG
jgi:hypothetical protein